MKTHSEITKVDFNRYVTPVSNLEVGDIINWIGIYDAGKEVYFDTITLLKYDRPIPFKIVDIDYNPNKPDDIIFEFDKVLVPTNSKPYFNSFRPKYFKKLNPPLNPPTELDFLSVSTDP